MHNRPVGNRGQQFRDPFVAAEIAHGQRSYPRSGLFLQVLIGISMLLWLIVKAAYRLSKFVWARAGKMRRGGNVIDSESTGIKYRVYDPERDDRR
ncbi:MAG: hypothetical protein HQ478_01825 [Chloroflexi bacterium]|nr:hypothetical protein [Chloroflexota bacterium]